MGNSSSRSVSEVPLHDIGLDMKVKYNTEELTSYEAACHEDGDLRSFDADLHARTSHVISTLAEGVEVQALSFESFKEVTGCLLDMNQQVVKVILECKKDIWKNQELFNLVEDYLESSLQTLDFCSALNKCLKRARDAQLLIHVALQHFEEEDEIECGQTSSGRYMRTLEDLRHFKAAGDPFTVEFFVIFQSVYRQQVLMLQKLQIRRKKLDKKLRYIRTWRKVSSMIFMVTFTALLICSVVAAAVATPTVAAALAAAVPAGSMGKLVDQLWKKYENSVKGQKEVVTSMQVSTNVAIKDLEGIRALVDRLEVEIESLMKTAELATRGSEEEGGGGVVRLMVEDIGKKLSVFGKKVDELRVQADACGRDVRQARTVVLQRMIRNPTR